MIYDCDPADTISALRAANEDLAAQVKHWRDIVMADNPPIEELEFNLRAAKSELEIANAEINRLNAVIEKYRLDTTMIEWQNIDKILDVLEQAGCCRNGYIHAPEDVVANTIRDWLRVLYNYKRSEP